MKKILFLISFVAATLQAKKKVDFRWGQFGPLGAAIEDFSSGNAQWAKIPLWAVGRDYTNGTSSDSAYGAYPPEYPLAYLLGIFGSAFEISPKHIKNYLKKSVFEILELDYIKLPWGGRLYPAMIKNWTYKLAKGNKELAKCKEHSSRCNEQLMFIDGGISNMNLPFPLAEGRNVDIMFAFDASATIKKSPTLKTANDYISAGQLTMKKFSPIPNDFSVRVYNDPRDGGYTPGKPTVIYLPFDNSSCKPNYCDTFNFKYSSSDVDSVTSATSGKLTGFKQQIQKIFQAWHKKNN